MKIALIMMQKDEDHLLWPWVRYHGSRFGYDNCHIFDNGSTSPAVLDHLKECEALGVSVIYEHDKSTDYDRKHLIIKGKIDELREQRSHTAFIPLDCDEFLAIDEHGNVSLSGDRILSHIGEMAREGDYYLRVTARFVNSPVERDRFYRSNTAKVIFLPGSRSGKQDHGFHMRALRESRIIQTRLAYVEFHNRPYEQVLKSAREKLALRVPDFSDETLRNYTGRGHHLAKYFLMGEKKYLNRYGSRESVTIAMSTEFRSLGVSYPYLEQLVRNGM